MTGFFDIGDALALFRSIERRYNTYLAAPTRSTEDLLYIVLPLNHLREWISPNFARRRDGSWPEGDTESKKFSREVFELPEFATIRLLANGAKHATLASVATAYEAEVLMDDWADIDSVVDFDTRPTFSHQVDAEPIQDIIDSVLQKYRDWFEPSS